MSLKLFELLLQASIYTVTISVVSILIGFAIAIVLSGMLLSKTTLLVLPAQIFISFFRGVPLLVQLLLIYNMLPAIGLNVPSIVAAIAVSRFARLPIRPKTFAAALPACRSG
jgi:polar amino acid transport system permease protein